MSDKKNSNREAGDYTKRDVDKIYGPLIIHSDNSEKGQPIWSRKLMIILLGLTVGCGVIILIVLLFDMNSSEMPNPPSTEFRSNIVDSALDIIEEEKLLKEEEKRLRFVQDSINKEDSLTCIRTILVFFESMANEQFSDFSNCLSQDIYAYPNYIFKDKEELLRQVKPYWKIVKSERNSVVKNTVDYTAEDILEGNYRSIQLKIDYELISLKNRGFSKVFRAKFEFDSKNKIISYITLPD